jgi:hypothetical protein
MFIFLSASMLRSILVVGLGCLFFFQTNYNQNNDISSASTKSDNTNISKNNTASIKLFVPSYFNSNQLKSDNKGEWNKLLDDAKAGDVIILNPNSGPGDSIEDGFKKVVERAEAKGIVMLGYIYTIHDRGKSTQKKRDTKEIEADFAKYQSFYGIKDIFFDELEIQPEGLEPTIAFYTQICQLVHTKGGTTTLNPGTVVDEAFAKITDRIVVFESTYKSYKEKKKADFGWSLKDEYKGKIVHLVYDTDDKSYADAIAKAKELKVSWLYVTSYTDPEPWSKLPSYWKSEIEQIRK